ncbi:MAG: thioredoxin family protein [Pirellulaceae bacterium]|nr:thioredoxin family protein [Pirellulaceae bacterium]
MFAFCHLPWWYKQVFFQFFYKVFVMLRRSVALALASTFVLASASSLLANEGVKVGDKGPAFASLPGSDGKNYSLSDFEGKKATVVVFTCNRCPVAVAYEDRLVKFAKDYADKGVALVAINVNKGENLKVMKTRAEEKGFNFPYLYDASQESAKKYGATCTPHLFILDAKHNVAYTGAFDNSQRNPTEHHVADAVNELLEGKKVTKAETVQFGCGIKWNR